ncbi:hypothetical protein [Chitinophaga varians]|uniref:hypothetical protein n=1 Tax=Chitinophaga varians TaxID=2202339 RepID=UPI00165FF0CD|nr:hypothetical protein [Chitinophaga varians]MBC9913146.1 hypothetical protein [Chitinophaga varians]
MESKTTKERPILFSGDMVRAILEGRKTHTRRIVKPQPIIDEESGYVYSGDHKHMFKKCFLHSPWQNGYALLCPYGQPGNILYVKETWIKGHMIDENETRIGSDRYFYKAGPDIPDWHRPELEDDHPNFLTPPWKSPRFMPKVAARIWLQVTDIRVELVQDISKGDVISEGFACVSKDHAYCLKHAISPTWKYGLPESDGLPGAEGWQWHDWEVNPVDAYRKLWSKINGAESWGTNPWVWVISFRVLSTTGRPAKFPALCEAL